ncbi:MAG: aspartate--ammonia ligase [Oscillospiraceae bacterium]|nr:aspartate--ammonia ligase [Oscillospiraceae bacterium]
MSTTQLPEHYRPLLDIMQTEIAIKLVKDTFERELAQKLHLTRVSAPLFVRRSSGINDNLNGVERPVSFDIADIGEEVEIVHSLAKWKRVALRRYGFGPNTGLYTDMNAIRRDEELDNLHSVYVDQWDWEKIITRETRTEETLRHTVRRIMRALKETEEALHRANPEIEPFISEKVTFLTAEELLQRYPGKTPKERENAAAREFGTVFIMGIGGALSDGKPHDGRAPDYDDWSLNGDILVWYPVLERAVELSSMGIRVDGASLRRQLELAGCTEREKLPYHQMLLHGELPLTIGGGIGQSRLCMVLLHKAHIGEVQSSLWDEGMVEACAERGVILL